jgi:hypothetical protein
VVTGRLPDEGPLQIGSVSLPAVLAQRPPRTLESAQRVAAEHWAFCREFGGTGLHDIPGITASLMSSPIWTFWWD